MISKADLRDRARAHRKGLCAADTRAAELAADHVSAMLNALFGRAWEIGEAGRNGHRLIVAIYQARGAEIDPGPTARALNRLGCDLALPSVETCDAPLTFRAWAPGDELVPDQVGSAAPPATVAEIAPDLIVTPLLAFDRFGQRLGQGGGYYDRTFAARPQTMRVGLAWAGQAVDRLPVGPHDIALHGVLTETGYTPARKAD